MKTKLKLYVGCAIECNRDPGFLPRVAELKKQLGGFYEILHFQGAREANPQPKAVYRTDIDECCATCDVFLAICDYPSTGLGLEIGACLWKRNPPVHVLAVASNGMKVSRLI